MQTKFPAGSRVRFTAAFLRSTGQVTGSAGMDRWTVQTCECGLCARGGFVATNERNCGNDGQRHIAVTNLQGVK